MKNLMLISIASLALAGCGKGRSNNPFKALATAKKAPELQGDYQSGCVSEHRNIVETVTALFKKGDLPASERTVLSFHGEDATVKEIHYLGRNCDGGEAFAFIEKGTFKVGDKDNNEKNNAGRFLDVKMTTVEATVLSDAGAKYANAASLCSKVDWKQGDSPKDVTAQSNDDDCYGKVAQRSIATVYQVDNSTLALGYIGNGSVEAKDRATSLSSTTFRRKD